MGLSSAKILQRADRSVSAGRLVQAEAVLREALAAAPAEGILAARLEAKLGETLFAQGKVEAAEAVLRASLRIHGRTGWSDDAAEAHRLLGITLQHRGQLPEAVQLLRYAIAEQGSRGGAVSASLRALLGKVLYNTGRVEEGLRVLLDAAERYRASGNLAQMVACRIPTAFAYAVLGRQVEAAILLRELFPMISALPFPVRAGQLCLIAIAAILSGMKKEALSWAKESLKVGRRQEGESAQARQLSALAWAEDHFGDPIRARALYAEALETAGHVGDRFVLAEVRLNRATGSAHRGDRAGLAADLDVVERELSFVTETADAPFYFTLQARRWMSLDDEKAFLFSTSAVEAARNQGAPLTLGPALHRLGEALIGLGRAPEAVAPLREGLEAFQRCNRPEDAAEVTRLLQSIGAPATPLAVTRSDARDGALLIAESPAMREIIAEAARIAPSNAAVVLEGESGSGKEALAREIHRLSGRKGLFVVLQGGLMSGTLAEDELFGHTKGAYTGALTDRRGKFELADGGTLFVDYLSEIPPAVQAKLLRVIQFGEIVRLGSEETRKVDVRLISASQVPLKKLVEEGQLREDLYYRLGVLVLSIPPLRYRREDIPFVFRRFLSEVTSDIHRSIPRLSAEAEGMLVRYHFPGNLRELENIVRRAVILCEGDEIRSEHLPPHVRKGTPALVPALDIGSDVSVRNLKAARAAVERAWLERLVERAGNHMGAAARLSGMKKMQLYRMMRRSGDPRKRGSR